MTRRPAALIATLCLATLWASVARSQQATDPSGFEARRAETCAVLRGRLDRSMEKYLSIMELVRREEEENGSLSARWKRGEFLTQAEQELKARLLPHAEAWRALGCP